ncbi:unnamed protein product [Ceutorhynchus assimilis]|uniref:Nitric oxide-associated protein 1 n=1 Tax=Ceutorhynchus assimilis TaxID=467358 RepID=A0A9N9ML44_9CUCU|nr:unnamed protein product [Ceutorhynchus assimilis]
MFLLKRISKVPIKESYCCFRTRIFSKRISKLAAESKSCEEKSNLLIKKYEPKLLYNSFIESRRMNFGFKKNAAALSNRSRFEERMRIALQTVQPLPISLKYSLDDNNCEQTEEQTLPGKLIMDKENIVDTEEAEPSTNFPPSFPLNFDTKVDDINFVKLNKPEPITIKDELEAKKKFLDKNNENWMTHYENYEQDLIYDESDNSEVNYGTPDPKCPMSKKPCGGCGAHLHCQDTAIPGYIPSEIFKNCFNPGGANLESILCQRCHFLKEYNVALQVRVSPDDYPKILQNISFNSAFTVLIVDLTDFPCSIWPGIADILGPKAPLVVVGNKVDLLPKDDRYYLKRVKDVLLDNLKMNGFGSANIKHIELISAKTGFGVENLISALQKVWRYKGDVYLIGSTNVGKSSLYNILLQSDFCKIQAADLIQRATTSPWPGTTLNLLKFPVARLSGHRMYVRQKRLEELRKIEDKQVKLNEKALHEHNVPKYATLMGHIERSIEPKTTDDVLMDNFTTVGNSNLSGKTKMGINENLAEFAFGKWCYDTPGVVHPDQILHLLTTEELVKTLPKEIIRPESYCIKPGTSLFIAGLARLDFVKGPNPIRLTVFKANPLPITICKTEEADSVYDELLGTKLFMVPIFNEARAQKWPGLEVSKLFTVFGKSIKESSYDIVLSNAGWVAINCGLAHYEFKAWTPEKRGVYLRDSLLPKAVCLRGRRIRDSVAYRKSRFI